MFWVRFLFLDLFFLILILKIFGNVRINVKVSRRLLRMVFKTKIKLRLKEQTNWSKCRHFWFFRYSNRNSDRLIRSIQINGCQFFLWVLKLKKRARNLVCVVVHGVWSEIMRSIATWKNGMIIAFAKITKFWLIEQSSQLSWKVSCSYAWPNGCSG